MRTDARIASRRIKLLAALIDATAGVLGLAALLIVSGGAAFVCMKVRGDRGPSTSEPPGTGGDFRQSAWWSGVVRVATFAFAPVGRNWRGPGYRLLGLRRVDARSGGPVSIRSAVAGAMFDSACRAASASLVVPRLRRDMERMAALQPQMKQIMRKYADDREAQQKALMQFYKTNRVSPLPACVGGMLPDLLSDSLLVLCSRRGRTIRDRVTRTVVILDR